MRVLPYSVHKGLKVLITYILRFSSSYNLVSGFVDHFALRVDSMYLYAVQLCNAILLQSFS